MQNILEYHVASMRIRTDQQKMLDLIFTIKSDKIRKFCFNSLVKDKILKRLEEIPPALQRTIYVNDPDIYFDFIMEKFTYIGNDTDYMSNNHTYFDNDIDTYEINNTKKMILTKFHELLEHRANGTSSNTLRQVYKDMDGFYYRYYSTIILNTMFWLDFFKMTDAAQAEVTLDDFK